MADQIIYAGLAGILPALVWLLFWLREDRKNPEPNGLILKTFLLGMLSVVLVLPFQKGVEMLLPQISILTLFFWALFEELFKFGAGYFGGLKSRDDNEPVDPIIYMITGALGFVALENTLFLLGPMLGQQVPESIITGNLRFIGASLLHVVASGFIGIAFSFNFYKNPPRRKAFVWIALIGAIIFHTIFNSLILGFPVFGTPIAFIMVWIGVILLLLAFERAKTIAPPENTSYN